MRTYIEEYEYWMNSSVVDEKTKSELLAISGNDDEIQGRFNKMMTFGTGGLRSTMKAGISTMNVYTVRHATQALANVAIRENGKSAVIAFDSRNNSSLFAREAARVLAANNIKAYIFDSLRPTPELSFAVIETGSIAGINITASHNAKEYNGYKAYWGDGGQVTKEHANRISTEIEKIDIFNDVKVADYDEALSNNLIEIIGEEMDEKYLSQVLKQSITDEYIKSSSDDFKLVYTPFHGAGYRLVPEVLKRIGIKNLIPVNEQMIIDGDFPTVASPNPENADGFALAIDYAKKYDADLIIGTDPDSDRCGVVVKNKDEYVVLSGNQTACLMLDYIITVRKQNCIMPKNPAACKSIVSTSMADKICSENGVTMINVLTGFKYIGDKIREFETEKNYNFIFGFEESLGFLSGTYTRDKDAVFAAMFMCEVACYYKAKGMTLYEGLQSLYDRYGHFVELNDSFWFQGYDAQNKMNAVMDGLRKNPPLNISRNVLEVIDYLSGVPGFEKSDVLTYKLEGGSSITIRPSGTEPRVKAYVMAQDSTKDEAYKCAKDILDATKSILNQ